MCVDGVDTMAASIIMETSVEKAKQQCESLDLRIVAHALIFFGMPPEHDHIVKQNTKSAFLYGEVFDPKLAETFTTYYEIVNSVIPPNI